MDVDMDMTKVVHLPKICTSGLQKVFLDFTGIESYGVKYTAFR